MKTDLSIKSKIWNKCPKRLKAYILAIRVKLGLKVLMVYPYGSKWGALILPKDEIDMYDDSKIINKSELQELYDKGFIYNTDIVKLFLKYL